MSCTSKDLLVDRSFPVSFCFSAGRNDGAVCLLSWLKNSRVSRQRGFRKLPVFQGLRAKREEEKQTHHAKYVLCNVVLGRVACGSRDFQDPSEARPGFWCGKARGLPHSAAGGRRSHTLAHPPSLYLSRTRRVLLSSRLSPS